MKKLSKNLNLMRESMESYNIYSCSSCDCDTYCSDRKASYRSYKLTMMHVNQTEQ